MMLIERTFNSRTIPTCLAAVAVTGLLALAGCSGDAEEKQRFKKPAARETTAESAGAAAENQTGYIMDRYHAPEERLRRRQARLSTVLDQPVPAQTTPQK